MYLDIDLPNRVLLNWENTLISKADPVPLSHPNDCGAIWYRAHADAFDINGDGTVKGWAPENQLGNPCVPVQPNPGKGRLGKNGALKFDSGVNTGLVSVNALIDAQQFSLAIRFNSPINEARTLITINPDGHENYLFLKEQDGQLEWQDRKGLSRVSTPGLSGDYWVVVSSTRGALTIATSQDGVSFNNAPPSTPNPAIASALVGPSSLFVGCRSHRTGILKTLGQSAIKDILFWIDQDVLRPEKNQIILLSPACSFAQSSNGET